MKKNKINTTTRQELSKYIHQLLAVDRFKDYCPNGLQVQGKDDILRIVTGVTASQALIEEAIEAKADALIVHHGWFWKNDEAPIVGQLHQRLKLLMKHDINLFAYHLPLDAHELWGNNAQLGQRLGLIAQERFGDQQLGWLGQAPEGGFADARALAAHVQSVLGREVVCVAAKQGPLRRIAWCTGGAQGYFESAIAAGAEAFITGEISEPQAHYARECGVTYVACGHHASERYGVQAVAQQVAAQLGLAHTFVDIDNPA